MAARIRSAVPLDEAVDGVGLVGDPVGDPLGVLVLAAVLDQALGGLDRLVDVTVGGLDRALDLLPDLVELLVLGRGRCRSRRPGRPRRRPRRRPGSSGRPASTSSIGISSYPALGGRRPSASAVPPSSPQAARNGLHARTPASASGGGPAAGTERHGRLPADRGQPAPLSGYMACLTDGVTLSGALRAPHLGGSGRPGRTSCRAPAPRRRWPSGRRGRPGRSCRWGRARWPTAGPSTSRG